MLQLPGNRCLTGSEMDRPCIAYQLECGARPLWNGSDDHSITVALSSGTRRGACYPGGIGHVQQSPAASGQRNRRELYVSTECSCRKTLGLNPGRSCCLG